MLLAARTTACELLRANYACELRAICANYGPSISARTAPGLANSAANYGPSILHGELRAIHFKSGELRAELRAIHFNGSMVDHEILFLRMSLTG